MKLKENIDTLEDIYALAAGNWTTLPKMPYTLIRASGNTVI